MKLIHFAIWTTSVALTASLMALVALYGLTRPSLKVLHTWKQPDSLNYQSYGPYYLSIVETDCNWRSLPFSFCDDRHHILYVGRDSGTPIYGHMLAFPFKPGINGMKTALQQAAVTWTPIGVTFKATTGHQLFIPKQAFIGGR
jgi:hypothetical protein